MSFLPAVQREINKRSANDPVRITLEFLLKNAVGRNHPVPLKEIVIHLQTKHVNITETGFQHSVLAESRSGDYFIGSGGHGYFLIDSPEDAKGMKDFYETRIASETRNLENLVRQSKSVGWDI